VKCQYCQTTFRVPENRKPVAAAAGATAAAGPVKK